MYFFNIVRHHVIFKFNTKWPKSSFLFFCEALAKSLKVWVKCDYFEALHIEMHVHTSNLNTDWNLEVSPRLVTFTKSNYTHHLHIVSTTHWAITCLISMGELCILGGGNLGKLEGGMWLWGDNKFVLWVLYNEKLVRQYFILHVTTLESWHNQYSHQSWLSLANCPCRTCWAHCPLTQD